MPSGYSTGDGIEVLDHDELEDVGEMSSVTQHAAFDTETTVVIYARIAGGMTSDWHHHDDVEGPPGK